MKKNYFLILSFSVTFSYWLLDAYMNVSLYHTTLMDELLLQSPHSLPFVKIMIACLILSLALIPLFIPEKKEISTPIPDEVDVLRQISQLLFASLFTKVNIIKSLEKLQEIFHLEASALFVYQKDTFSFYDENTFTKTFFRTKEISPFRTDTSTSEVESIAIACFFEKKEFSKDTFRHNGTPLTLFSFALKEDKKEKALGNLMLVCKDENAIMPHLDILYKIADLLAFALALSAKKESLTLLNNQQSSENSSYDKVLGLLNNAQLQKHIEHEVNRYKRYHTELTLIVFEINTLKNLTNIFPAEIITNLKKDFVQIIKKNIRDTDFFGKWANDQFALLLPDVDFRSGQGLAKKIQKLLCDHKFARIGNITCNFGISSISPKDTVGTFRARCESALALANTREGDAIEVKLLV